MGDASDPKAPGNVWKVADRWPVTSGELSFYLSGDMTLSKSSPTNRGGGVPSQSSGVRYVYDPNNPADSWGGIRSAHGAGNLDQRPLKDRKDILRFVSAALPDTVEITGNPAADLYFSSDTPDTAVVVKLVDVYPDGYEALITDGAIMTRYRNGPDRGEPLKRRQFVQLRIVMLPTAYAFAPGHRIALHVTGSAAGRFVVHPNTWDGIDALDEAKTARCEIGVSSSGASRLILPSVKPGDSVDFDPAKHLFVKGPAF
jgi:hypothetical protein